MAAKPISTPADIGGGIPITPPSAGPQSPAYYAAAFAAAPIRDMITCARVFYAAINSGGGRFSDQQMDELDSFDDFLAKTIADCRPETAEDFAAKAHYLICRVEADTLSAAAEAAAIAAIRTDAAAMAAELSGRGMPA